MALRAAGSHDCCPLYVGQRALSAAWPHTPVLPASSALEGAEPASPAPLPCCLQLRAALQEPDGSVPGFMKVCDCLVSTSSTGKEAGFSGMIIGELHGEWSAGWPVLVRPCALCAMEGRQRARWRAVRHGLGVWARDSCLPSHPLTLPPTLSSSAPPTHPCRPPPCAGWEVYKRIDTPEFHNIHYVREMLFQVRRRQRLGSGGWRGVIWLVCLVPRVWCGSVARPTWLCAAVAERSTTAQARRRCLAVPHRHRCHRPR
jgi:hypothetical protein